MVGELIAKYVQPLLSGHGFGVRKHTWNRRRGDFIDIVGVQKSRWNDAQREDFTINVGIWSDSVWRLYEDRPSPPFIEEQHCLVAFRVGQVLGEFKPQSEDTWWTLSSPDDIDLIGPTVASALQDRCLPFLGRFASLDDVNSFASRLPVVYPATQLQLAIVAHLLGDAEICEASLRDVVEHKSKTWARKAVEIHSRLESV